MFVSLRVSIRLTLCVLAKKYLGTPLITFCKYPCFAEFDGRCLSARHFEIPPKTPYRDWIVFARLWVRARKKIARRLSIYGRSSCNGLQFAIQIRFCRVTVNFRRTFSRGSEKWDFVFFFFNMAGG